MISLTTCFWALAGVVMGGTHSLALQRSSSHANEWTALIGMLTNCLDRRFADSGCDSGISVQCICWLGRWFCRNADRALGAYEMNDIRIFGEPILFQLGPIPITETMVTSTADLGCIAGSRVCLAQSHTLSPRFENRDHHTINRSLAGLDGYRYRRQAGTEIDFAGRQSVYLYRGVQPGRAVAGCASADRQSGDDLGTGNDCVSCRSRVWDRLAGDRRLLHGVLSTKPAACFRCTWFRNCREHWRCRFACLETSCPVICWLPC